LFWRYDAGVARLLRPVIKVKGPVGTTVEVCYCQALIDGKASPFHPLCGGASCYVDRYTVGVSGVEMIVTPLEPRGCRYVEIHAVLDDDNDSLGDVTVSLESALLRGYESCVTWKPPLSSLPDIHSISPIHFISHITYAEVATS
jgi:hypothetical protein